MIQLCMTNQFACKGPFTLTRVLSMSLDDSGFKCQIDHRKFSFSLTIIEFKTQFSAFLLTRLTYCH